MEWIPCKWRKTTEEEYETTGCAQIADFPIPENLQEILITKERIDRLGKKERYVKTDICYCSSNRLKLFLDSCDDWNNVLAWMPFPQPYDGEDLREENK